MKSCKNEKCKNINPQPTENFYRESANKTDGKQGVCKTCKNERTATWRAKRREFYNAYMSEYRKTYPKKYQIDRNKSLRSRYGLTQAQYDQMLADQGGTCALCDIRPSKRPLYVDHHHDTGKVRGLLCAGHNRSIAILDDAALLEKAMRYLKEAA